MAFLQNKNILITGLLSSRSIAYGIAKAMRREGAQLAFSYQGERVKNRVVELAAEFDSRLVFPCDVASDAEIEALFAELKKHWDGLDGIIFPASSSSPACLSPSSPSDGYGSPAQVGLR